jgi:uncharacterized protein
VTPGWLDALWVVLGGFGAGAVNGVAGGGTLLSFPALLAAGLSPVAANVTSSVGLLSGYVGGTVAYRTELEGQAPRVRRLAATSVVGGITGAVVLLTTPSSAFEAIVPWLVLLASALLVLQPWLARQVARRRLAGPGHHGNTQATITGITLPVQVGVFLGAVYGSYFGAGLGVLLLALLGVLLEDGLQRINALRGVISLIVNAVGVAIFVFSGVTVWWAAGLLFVTAYLGGHVGASLARRLPPMWLRVGVSLLGLVVGVTLLVRG